MQKVLEVNNLIKVRGTSLFNPVSFTVCAGEGIGLYGHNGCGKTTLLDMIAGLQKQSSGEIRLSTSIGYVMQNDGFQDNLSCRDNLIIEAAICGLKGEAARNRIDYCAALCEVTSYWKKKISKCSAGMRARVALAAAFISNPGLLLLDEAFNTLDYETVQLMKKTLLEKKSEGMAILLVSHDKEDFPGLCERVLNLPSADISTI